MAPKPGKHTPYFELVDAQSMAGCPICRLVYKATDRYLDALLYEAVLDPTVRAKLKDAHGFCEEHVEMLQRQPGRALGVALIYRDTLKELLQTLGGARVRSRRLLSWGARRASSPTAERLSAARPCPACEIAATTERDYVSLLLAHLSDDALYAAYVAGEGLCLPHLVAAVRGARDADTLRRLVEPQTARYEHMLGELDEFIRKHDHRFADEKYGEEGDVWLRVMNAVVGGAGRGLSAKSGGRRSNDIGR
ncbi:MAG: hypothetical protein GX557_08110 [Chloroflexi bacterium]|nr:hypothetical protein [Chloroflexota bacterium]